MNAKQCYKDSDFNGIKGFYCYTAEDADKIRQAKLRGQSTMNLTLATEADYKAAPTLVSGCNSCK